MDDGLWRPVSPEQFAAILNKDIERWGKTVKSSGLKGE